MKRRFLLVTIVVAFLVLGWSATQLPGRVAIHFGFDGTADGWTTRTGAVLVLGGVCLAMALMFLALGRWLPRMPWSLVNLPPAVKQRWVEAGQEDQLKASMAEDLCVVGGLTMLLLAGVQVLTVVANRRTPAAELGVGAVVLVGAFLIALTIWTVATMLKYRRPPA